MSSQRLLILCLFSSFIFAGCASGTFKARQEQREKMASSSGMFCDFISGDLFPDLEVELSMVMARRCDSNKNFSITNYKNSSDQLGVIYCCSTKMGGQRSAAAPRKVTAPVKTEAVTDVDADSDVTGE